MMQIAHHLEQFENTPTLLIITGKQEARLYFGLNGAIEEVVSLYVPKPKYSDLEGHFETRAHGSVFRSGSVYERPQNLVIQDFLLRLGAVLKKVARNLDSTDLKEVWLYCPQHMVNQITKVFPRSLRDKITKKISGNFSKAHLFDLLEKTARDKELSQVKPMSEEAKKIIEKVSS